MKLYELFESRSDSDNISYETKFKSKKGEGANQITKIIAYLKGKDSEVFTKMAARYAQIERIKKACENARNDLNLNIKNRFSDLFDIEDRIHTRVIDTVSLVATLSKPEAVETEYEEFDEEGFYSEIEELLKGLAVSLDDLRSKYTKMTPIEDPQEKSPKLLLKIKDTGTKVPVEEGIMDGISNFVNKIKSYYNKFLNRWDDRFNNLKSRVYKRVR
jgi:hypothetical protein